MIKPQIHITVKGKNEYEFAKTYRLLKKKIADCINKSDDEQISVYRSRRGQWGEWYEIWKLSNGKPAISEQGWS